MTPTNPPPPPEELEQQRQALQAVLESSVFKKSSRLARLLQYICDKHFSGDTRDVKEYSIAVDIFRRPTSFDPATDSIVRVEFYRLRKTLREFSDGEGLDQPLQIVIATGQYLPQFVPQSLATSFHEIPPPEGVKSEVLDIPAEALAEVAADPMADTGELAPDQERRDAARSQNPFRFPLGSGRWLLAACVLIAIIGLSVVELKTWHRHHARQQAPTAPLNSHVADASMGSAVPSNGDGTIRIRCGYTKPIFRDQAGNLWMGDRFFDGGDPTEVPGQHIAATRNAQLYTTYRSGTFSYKIPLPPGSYELRLHFAETTYGPAAPLGGGENSRVFDVHMNGKPLLTQFDIEADAGESTADVRVFKDVHPSADGFLHLDFIGVLGLPLVNAIEVLPGIPHRLHTLRMVAQDNFFVDKNGNLWSPDSYFIGGRLGVDKIPVNGTDEPGLYAGERYGNFKYVLPADPGTYTLTLFFSEKYWGEYSSKNDPAGKRVFDVRCNGIPLVKNLDIAKEVGPGHALVKTFSGLHPDPQGKIVVSFAPVENYALVDAVELQEIAP